MQYERAPAQNTVRDACATLLHNLKPADIQILFGILVVLGLCALGLLGCLIWFKGYSIKIGKWVEFAASAQFRALQDAATELSKDDKLKKRVLWMLRERLVQITAIAAQGFPEDDIRAWCGKVLIDVATAVSRGGEDRHRTSLWYAPAAGAELRMYAAHGFRDVAVAAAELKRNSIAGRVYQTGVAEVISDVTADPLYEPKPRTGPPYYSLMSIPVKNEADETIAVLCVDALAKGYFDEDDKFIGNCFGDALSTLLARAIRRAP